MISPPFSRSFGTLYIRPFGEGDPRLSLALERAEPRIHFALNCGAKSCPPIKTYSADSVSQTRGDMIPTPESEEIKLNARMIGRPAVITTPKKELCTMMARAVAIQ